MATITILQHFGIDTMGAIDACVCVLMIFAEGDVILRIYTCCFLAW